MPQYAIIVNDKIINTIIADSKEDAELLSNTECKEINEDFPYGYGWKFNGTEWINGTLEYLEENNA